MDLVKSPAGGAELMDYSLIDEGFSPGGPRFGAAPPASRANFVTLGSAPFAPYTAAPSTRLGSSGSGSYRSPPYQPAAVTAAAKVPSIYPSLHIMTDDEFLRHNQYDVNDDFELQLKSKPLGDEIIIPDDDDDLVTSQDLSPGALRAYPTRDGLSQTIELDSVKHKLSSLWNNVKYGWTTYLKKPAKISLDKNEPVYILGKRFDSENSHSLTSLEANDPNSSYDNCYDGPNLKSLSSEFDTAGYDSLKETPIYSLNAVNYDIKSPYSQLNSKVSPKENSFLSRMRTNSTRIDATYFFVDENSTTSHSLPEARSSKSPPSAKTAAAAAAASMQSESVKTLLDQEIHSRLWFTYRKDFEPLAGNPKYTSDCGWGCMLRSAQMLIGQALLVHFFGAGWSLYSSLKTESDLSMYKQILVWFNDRPSPECPFGLHRLLEIADRRPIETTPAATPSGAQQSTVPEKVSSRVGTWFGPTSVCLLMKDALNESFAANPLLKQIRIYCAQDCTIYKQDVIDLCCPRGVADEAAAAAFVSVVILVSVRLGGEDLNQIYTPSLKKFLAMENCIGLIGGKPKHSLYFIGYQGDKVIYLDPHLAQPTVVVSNSPSTATAASSKLASSSHSSLGQSFDDASILDFKAFDNASFHCSSPSKTSFAKLDPSLAIGFYCRTLRSLNELCDLIHEMSRTEMYPIFGINDATFEKAQRSFQVYFEDEPAKLKPSEPAKPKPPPAPSTAVQSQPIATAAAATSRATKLSANLQTYLSSATGWGQSKPDGRRHERSPNRGPDAGTSGHRSRGFMSFNLNNPATRFLSSGMELMIKSEPVEFEETHDTPVDEIGARSCLERAFDSETTFLKNVADGFNFLEDAECRELLGEMTAPSAPLSGPATAAEAGVSLDSVFRRMTAGESGRSRRPEPLKRTPSSASFAKKPGTGDTVFGSKPSAALKDHLKILAEKNRILKSLSELAKEELAGQQHLEHLSVAEEAKLLRLLRHVLMRVETGEAAVLDALIGRRSADQLSGLMRLRRKLELRSFKRERHVRLFDIDSYANELIDREKAARRHDWRLRAADAKPDLATAENQDDDDDDVIFEAELLKTTGSDCEIVAVKCVLDRFKTSTLAHDHSLGHSAIGMVQSRVDDVKCVLSPFTNSILKPYVRRDFETLPRRLRVHKELLERTVGSSASSIRHPIDYVHLRPEHVMPINGMCREHFWNGIDITECLDYPDYTLVALYRKLVVGFAFLVPHAEIREFYLSFIFVHPDWRLADATRSNHQVSIAHYMLFYLIQASGSFDITLHVSVTSPVVVLYQKFGFKIEEYIRNFYDKYYSDEHNLSKDAFLMRLTKA